MRMNDVDGDDDEEEDDENENGDDEEEDHDDDGDDDENDDGDDVDDGDVIYVRIRPPDSTRTPQQVRKLSYVRTCECNFWERNLNFCFYNT